ncbi:MAG: HD domain-containing protein [Candidatus Taylorbacteria bacterium]|nr:HD domain-containing protein [Candidatus Taylorbacteria bacterium]
MLYVSAVYEDYRIMPSLQEHQLRVASVAQLIADASAIQIDTETVVKACIFHDMGNIIKSDLALFPAFVEEKGIEYWEKVKKEYKEKYGPDEHLATIAIAKEIGLSDRVRELIDSIGFSKLAQTLKSNDLEKFIVEYADMRVSPTGVVSVDERLREGRARYEGKKSGFDVQRYSEMVDAIYIIEKSIFLQSSLTPEDITDERVVPLMEKMRTSSIKSFNLDS